MSTKPWILGAVLIGLPWLAGCGYTRHAVLPQNIKSIYVENVKNEIPLSQVYVYQPGLEMAITKALVRRFNRDGNLRVAPTADQADAILKSSLRDFEQEGLRFTSLESVEEYRLFIVVSLRLIDARSKKVIWEEPSFSGDAEYFVSNVRSVAREEATQRAIERLARNVVDRVVEDW